MNKKYIGIGSIAIPFIALFIYGWIEYSFLTITLVYLGSIAYLALITYGVYLLTNEDE